MPNANILMNEVPSESSVPQQTLATHQKDKYSASNDIRRSNFNNITSQLARISNKADQELADLKMKLRKEQNDKATLKRHEKAKINRGLFEKDPSVPEFSFKATKKMKALTIPAIPSAKALENKNKEKLKTRLIPRYAYQKQHKIKKLVIQGKGRKKVKSAKKVQPTKVTVEEETQQEKINQNMKLSRKRRLINEQKQYVNISKQKAIKKKKKQHQQIEENQRMRDINEQLNQLEKHAEEHTTNNL